MKFWEPPIWQTLFLSMGLLCLPILIIASDPQFRPGVEVNQDAACGHESHAHMDEDLRVRIAVHIRDVDKCGFTYETRTETGRLEFCADTVVVEGPDGLSFSDSTQITLVPKKDIRKNRVAMVFFCDHCKQVVTIRLRKEATQR